MRVLVGIVIGIVLGAFAVASWVVFMPMRSVHQVPPVEAQSEQRTDMEVALTDGYLTRQMQQELQGANLPVQLSELRIATEAGNRVIARFVAEAYGQRVNGSVVMAAQINDGALSMKVIETDIGNFPLPGSIGGSLETQINSRVQQLIAGSTFRIVGARTSNGSLVVAVQDGA
jgi:hypothetical protein